MKKIIRLTESDLRRIVKKTLKESMGNGVVESIVHKHMDKFVNETLDRFIDVMGELSNDLNEEGISVLNNFYDAETHFEGEMLSLSKEIIHKIHNDEQIKHHMETASSSSATGNHH